MLQTCLTRRHEEHEEEKEIVKRAWNGNGGRGKTRTSSRSHFLLNESLFFVFFAPSCFKLLSNLQDANRHAPPSTQRTWPLTCRQASPARKAQASAISAGRP